MPQLAQLGVADVQTFLDPERFTRVPGRWELLAKAGLGGRQRWRWTLPGSHAPQVVYLKVYQRTALREQWDRIWRQVVRHSRGWWEFEVSRLLSESSVPAVEPVACVERMSGGLERASAVLLQGVAGDALDRLWPRLVAQNAAVARVPMRWDVIRRLARFVSAFHGTGLCHRDLYLCHIFGVIDADGREPPRFTLIDLARTHKPRWRRMRWLIKDLAQLDASARHLGISRSERWRFLMAYLSLEPAAPRLRWYARRIVPKSDWILARMRRP
jgi:Lipopolysaccharide kinase (Kdo/WaaP) family